jgi:hypothetical protein
MYEKLEYLRRLYLRSFRVMDEKDYIVISVSNEFEPNGGASEDWEDYYTITCKYIPSYIPTSTGWRISDYNIGGTKFIGATLDIALDRAINLFECLIKGLSHVSST